MAFVIPSLGSGGAERVVSTLANELSAFYDVTIICFTKTDPFYKLGTNVKLLYCVDHIAPSTNMIQAIKSNYKLLKKLTKHLKKEKADVCIGFLTSANVLSALASKWVKIPCIISERIDPKNSKVNKFWDSLRRYCYKKATYLVVQTEEIKAYFANYFPGDHIYILQNPINRELTEKRNGHQYPKENFILNVGRLNDQKGQDTLIEAFSEMKNQEWKLLIVGEGKNRKQYEALISKLQLHEKVELIGSTKDISSYYNRAGIFAFTSRFEGFPNALIEAMHFGVPSISTNCPTGPSEIIKHGENGFLIPVDDKEELKAGLNELITNPEKRNKFSIEGMKSVEKFKSDNVIKQWDELIKRCLSSRT